jgi:hypothetical protein
MPTTPAAGWNTDQMPGLPEPGIARVRRSCQQRVPGHACDRVHVSATSARGTGRSSSTGRPDATALAANGRGSRSPGSATPGHQDLAALLPGPSPCASASLTSSSRRQTSATCCTRSTATRPRSCGKPRLCSGVRTVPVPDRAVTGQGRPGALFRRVMNSSRISRTALDHPRKPGGRDHAEVALADLPVTGT